MQEIKLVAVDLDGTLLNSQHRLSEGNEKAIKAVVSQNIPVVIATGKTRASALHLIDRLGLTTPGIFMQGLLVYNGDGSIRHEQTLDQAVARQVITFAEERGFMVTLHREHEILFKNDHPMRENYERHGETNITIAGPLQNRLHERSIHKVAFHGDEKRIRALHWQLGMQLNGQAALTRVGVEGMLELLPAGASKGKALRTLLKDMAIKPENVLAIGDAENDMEMLELVGVGVAMGNARDALKTAADHVVASNDDDGVSEALKKFVPGIEAALRPEAVAEPDETVVAEGDGGEES